ncbi:MAG TPA: TonB-dependent receptor [Thermoanaerobaculia bacterium]|jgi:outer membrane receptor protein involved in Fe transport
MSARRTLALFLLFLLLPLALFAQSSTGSISGTITDDSGAAVPGVTVTAVNAATGITRTAVSNGSGYYQVALLPPGTYRVEAALEGFQPVRRDVVTVNVGTDVALNLAMRVGASETVTVTASAPLVETERTQVSSVVNETAIQNLPTNGRNFIDFVLTTPGVVRDVRAGDISFAGQRGTLNSLVIDGANNDNTFFGQSLGRTGSGRAPYQFSQDAVKEFQVNANAYSAEYGRAGGAVINVVTKSGTNDLDGSLFYFLRDKRYNTNDYINEINNRAKSPYHFDQYGTSLGGPLVRDKHFFFVNYDAQRNDLPNPVVLGGGRSIVIHNPDDQRGYDALLTHAADYVRRQDQDVYLIKTDHELFANAHLSLRYNRQEFVGKNYENGAITNAVEHTGDSLVNTDTLSGVFATTTGASFFNEVRAQYAKDREPGMANISAPETEVFHDGNLVLRIGQNTFSPRETTIKRYQLADTATLLVGPHTIKSGFDISRDNILNYFPGNFAGTYRFNSLADFANNKPARFLQAFAGPGTSGATTNPDITEYGLFVQDEWHLLRTLTMTAGLRYDLQKIAQPDVHNPSAELAAAGIDTSLVPEDRNNLAPRLGFAWTPGDGRTVVRGGYGIFYGRTPAIMIGTAHSNNGINVQTLTFTGASIPAYPNVFTTIPTGGTAGKPTILVFDRDYENPQVHQGSLGAERGLTSDILVGVTYQYVKGEDLSRSADINIASPAIVAANIAGGGSVNYRKYNGRAFNDFSRIIEFQSSARSRYDGVTLDLQKRFSHNWQARLAYTWSTVKDDKPDATAVVPGTDDAKFISDPGDFSTDYTYGDNDVRHRVVLSGVWSLDSYAAGIGSGFLRSLASGWTLSGVASYQSGQPFTPVVNADLNNDGNASNDIAPGFRRNSQRLPSQLSIDPRLTRDLAFGGVHLQLIAEAFNVLNRSNVSNVNRTYYSYTSGTNTLTRLSAYGTPTVSTGPRILQLAAKITF